MIRRNAIRNYQTRMIRYAHMILDIAMYDRKTHALAREENPSPFDKALRDQIEAHSQSEEDPDRYLFD